MLGDPFHDLRDDGISGTPSFCKVGRIQSEAKPAICRRSLPLNHLTPSSRVRDEKLATKGDTRWGIEGKQSRGSESIRLPWLVERAKRARYCFHWLGVSQELNGGHSSKTCDQENATATLGDSEIPSIQHAPKSHIPAFGKALDDCLKVAAIVDSEEVRDVFKDHPRGLYFAEYANDLEEKPASASGKPRPGAADAAGSADVLAREPGRDDVDFAEIFPAAFPDVDELLGVRKSVGKDSPVCGIDFDLPPGNKSGSLEAEIEASDSCEQATDCWLLLSIHNSLSWTLDGVLVWGSRLSTDLRFRSADT